MDLLNVIVDSLSWKMSSVMDALHWK